MAEIPMADADEPSDNKGRPLGITVLAILQMIGALITLGLGVTIMAFGSISPFYGIMGGILVIFGLISFYVGYGLWTMKSWAWKLAMIVNIINIVIGVITQNWVGIIIPLIIVIYLNQEDIKQRFR
ncbi:MAG: hypothetical protein R6V83_02105 [Candidatus Thorarchaeota archaeon]